MRLDGFGTLVRRVWEEKGRLSTGQEVTFDTVCPIKLPSQTRSTSGYRNLSARFLQPRGSCLDRLAAQNLPATLLETLVYIPCFSSDIQQNNPGSSVGRARGVILERGSPRGRRIETSPWANFLFSPPQQSSVSPNQLDPNTIDRDSAGSLSYGSISYMSPFKVMRPPRNFDGIFACTSETKDVGPGHWGQRRELTTCTIKASNMETVRVRRLQSATC